MTATKFMSLEDVKLLTQTREAMQMVKESQSPTASQYERNAYNRRLGWLEELMEKVAARKLLAAL